MCWIKRKKKTKTVVREYYSGTQGVQGTLKKEYAPFFPVKETIYDSSGTNGVQGIQGNKIHYNAIISPIIEFRPDKDLAYNEFCNFLHSVENLPKTSKNVNVGDVFRLTYPVVLVALIEEIEIVPLKEGFPCNFVLCFKMSHIMDNHYKITAKSDQVVFAEKLNVEDAKKYILNYYEN